MIIDTHSQLWTKDAIESFPKAMAEGYRAMFKDMGLPSIKDTLKDMDAAGVDKAVIVAVDAETIHKYRVSNDLVAQTAAESLGGPVLFHTGTQFHFGTRIKYCRPLFADDVAVDFPRLKLIVAHFGY